MVTLDFMVEAYQAGLDPDEAGFVLSVEMTREQAEELFTDLFIKLTDKSEDERSK